MIVDMLAALMVLNPTYDPHPVKYSFSNFRLVSAINIFFVIDSARLWIGLLDSLL